MSGGPYGGSRSGSTGGRSDGVGPSDDSSTTIRRPGRGSRVGTCGPVTASATGPTRASSSPVSSVHPPGPTVDTSRDGVSTSSPPVSRPSLYGIGSPSTHYGSPKDTPLSFVIIILV